MEISAALWAVRLGKDFTFFTHVGVFSLLSKFY